MTQPGPHVSRRTVAVLIVALAVTQIAATVWLVEQSERRRIADVAEIRGTLQSRLDYVRDSVANGLLPPRTLLDSDMGKVVLGLLSMRCDGTAVSQLEHYRLQSYCVKLMEYNK